MSAQEFWGEPGPPEAPTEVLPTSASSFRRYPPGSVDISTLTAAAGERVRERLRENDLAFVQQALSDEREVSPARQRSCSNASLMHPRGCPAGACLLLRAIFV